MQLILLSSPIKFRKKTFHDLKKVGKGQHGRFTPNDLWVNHK